MVLLSCLAPPCWVFPFHSVCCAVTQRVSGSCLLGGGCKQLTKGLNNAQSRSEQRRGAITVEKVLRRKRSGPLRAGSSYQSGTGLSNHLWTQNAGCSFSSILLLATVYPSPSEGSSPPLTLSSALPVYWYLILTTGEQWSAFLASWSSAMSDGSNSCWSQEKIKANSEEEIMTISC